MHPYQGDSTLSATAAESFFVSLPRQPRLPTRWAGGVSPPKRGTETFKPNPFRLFRRVLTLADIVTRFLASTLWDAVRGKNTIERRAARVCSIIKKLGGTFVKAGQQMSMRIDLLPDAYCREFEKLLDRVDPVPLPVAIEIIERTIGKPLAEAFAVFDPKPIGSASVSCVYQAVTKNGNDRVAVKVRRPQIGQNFAEDLFGFEWTLKFLELFVLTPGFSVNFIYELRTMLFEELDFIQEARHTELFRRRVKKAKLCYATAPRVYFDLSGREVLTTEFVSGNHLTDVIGAVESDSEEARELLRERRLNPKILARRILRVIRWSGNEGLFFNADPHPANILVKPDNRLVFIDFGSVGSFTDKDLVAWRRVIEAQGSDDVGRMVDAILALLEPLEAVDIDSFVRKLEQVFWKDLFAFKSKHSEWWEKTTANLWASVLRMINEYGMKVNLNTLRMIRATMISDTLCARLHPKINHYREFRTYQKNADKRARKRLMKRFRRFEQTRWQRTEQIANAVLTAAYRAQRFLDTPILAYAKMLSKSAHFFFVLLKSSALGTIMGALALTLWRSLDMVINATHVAGDHFLHEVLKKLRNFLFVGPYQDKLNILENFFLVLSETMHYQIALLLITLIIARWILSRLRMMDID